jgi:hypothetical protein
MKACKAFYLGLATFALLLSLSFLFVKAFGKDIFEERDLNLCNDDTFCLSGLILFKYMTNALSILFIVPMASLFGGYMVAEDAGSIVITEFSLLPDIVKRLLNHWIFRWLFDKIIDAITYTWSWFSYPFTIFTRLCGYLLLFIVFSLPFVLIYKLVDHFLIKKEVRIEEQKPTEHNNKILDE